MKAHEPRSAHGVGGRRGAMGGQCVLTSGKAERGEAALAVAREVLGGSIADRPVWTLARLAAEVAARTGETVSPGHLSVVLRKGATAGAGRGTPSRAGRTRTPSTAPACGSGC